MLNLFKHIFWSAAHRADPFVREFVKGCVWRDITVGIALFRIVNITTDFTFPFLHLFSPINVKGALCFRSGAGFEGKGYRPSNRVLLKRNAPQVKRS